DSPVWARSGSSHAASRPRSTPRRPAKSASGAPTGSHRRSGWSMLSWRPARPPEPAIPTDETVSQAHSPARARGRPDRRLRRFVRPEVGAWGCGCGGGGRVDFEVGVRSVAGSGGGDVQGAEAAVSEGGQLAV